MKKRYISLSLLFVLFAIVACANHPINQKPTNEIFPVESTIVTAYMTEETFPVAEFAAQMEQVVAGQSTDELESSENATIDPDTNPDSIQALRVHFVDVGQGNAVLIELAGKYMLVDGGDKNKKDTVASYLKSNDVQELEYVVATHPHADHIGGLPTVLRNFDVKKILMPDVQSQTLIFEDLLYAIQDTDIGISIPALGDIFALGDAMITVVAPVREYGDNLNNASIGIRIDFHNTSFLLAGDAESASEQDMLSSIYDLQADVFLANHHGSNTSNHEDFLRAISPSYVVISVGAENTYGHPSVSVMERLDDLGITHYRTDEYGTIIASSDGNVISWNLEKTTTERKDS